MPKQVTIETGHPDKWNFYVNKLDMLEFAKAIAKTDNVRATSAAIRALIHLYVTDSYVQTETNKIIGDYIVLKANNKPSKL